jgi:hypothetical protein
VPYRGRYSSLLPKKQLELLVKEGTKVYISLRYMTFIASQHFILAYIMNWLRRIHQEEDDDDDDENFGDDDENLIMAYQFLQQQASGSHPRHNPDAPPWWPNKRDHVVGDAQICVDYFGPNPVSPQFAFVHTVSLKTLLMSMFI